MGRDKARLPWDGSTLLEHALEKLRFAGFTPAIAGLREPAAASAPCVSDNYPGDGPLAGMEAALRLLNDEPGERVLFTPVDLPLLPASFLRFLWQRAENSGAAVTVPYALGHPQPLCSVVSTRLSGHLTQALGRGDRKVMRVLAEAAGWKGFDTFEVETLAPLHGWEPQRWFTNLNRPADYFRLQIPTQLAPLHGRPVQSGVK